jgi:hypothetical protein
MAVSPSDFDDVRRDPDPIRRGRRATELLTVYQQRAAELARLRRAAIESAHAELGMSYTQIAVAMGITKGRVSQIRAAAPLPERAFFGTGPVAVGVPRRYGVAGRPRPLLAAEDVQTGEEISRLLAGYALAVVSYQIEPETGLPPGGDGVVICGPKTAPVGARLLAEDPELGMVQEAGRWWIVRRATGERYGSAADEPRPSDADVAYLARHQYEDRVIVHIAGIHAIGSLGAARFLAGDVGSLYADYGEASLSLVVRSSYDGLTITSTSVIAGPFPWHR